MKMRTPGTLAESIARRAAPLSEVKVSLSEAAASLGHRADDVERQRHHEAQVARNLLPTKCVDEMVRPREDLCEFDARGMNEVEGRK